MIEPRDAMGPPGKRLYHYTRLETALQHIVPTQTIRLGPFSAMRDPRESADWAITVAGFPGVDRDVEDDLRDFWAFNRRINELKSYVKVLSLTQDAVLDGDPRAVDFGRGYAHPRLWEQYADNHRGVCLCFDRELVHQRLAESLDPFGELHARSVDYDDREIAPEAVNALIDKLRVDGPIEAAAGHLRDNIEELLFTKLRDWETETEYRFAIQTAEPGPIDAGVSTALRAVILGADEGSRFYEPAFAKICDPAEVEIFQMRWNHGRPHLGQRHDPAVDRG